MKKKLCASVLGTLLSVSVVILGTPPGPLAGSEALRWHDARASRKRARRAVDRTAADLVRFTPPTEPPGARSPIPGPRSLLPAR